MKDKFFPGVMTRAEVRDWRSRLGEIKDEIFHQTKKGKVDFTPELATDVLKKHVPQDDFQNWHDFLLGQRENFQKELDLLIKYLEGYERCEVTVARPLSKAAYERLVNWFKSQNILRVIVEIKIDDTVGGGATIAMNGKIYDYSLKKKIAEDLKHI